LETFQLYRMGSHPTNPNIMIGGLQDNGTVMTLDGGETWERVLGGDGMECFIDRNNPDNVYASYYNGYLMRSTDGGLNFSYFKSMEGAWVTPFFQHTQIDTIYYTANNDIWRYPQDKFPVFVWQRMTTNLMPVVIVAFEQSEINPDHMIIAGNDEYQYGVPPDLDTIPVLISTDGGYNWTNVTANIPGETKWISSTLTHPNQENTMYFVRCGFSEGNKIYRTNDLGETWTNISSNIPDIPCNDLFIDPEIPYHYYVGTDLGVYFSDNEGESWEYAGDGMPKVPIMDFDYVKIDNTRYLRVATYGRGIYETYLPPPTAVEAFSDFKFTLRIMPNPCKNDFTVEYTLIRPGKVHIDIYNQLGGKVKMVLNKHQSKGKHELTIKGNDLAAGIYFCTLKTGEGIQTRKIIKL